MSHGDSTVELKFYAWCDAGDVARVRRHMTFASNTTLECSGAVRACARGHVSVVKLICGMRRSKHKCGYGSSSEAAFIASAIQMACVANHPEIAKWLFYVFGEFTCVRQMFTRECYSYSATIMKLLYKKSFLDTARWFLRTVLSELSPNQQTRCIATAIRQNLEIAQPVSFSRHQLRAQTIRQVIKTEGRDLAVALGPDIMDLF